MKPVAALLAARVFQATLLRPGCALLTMCHCLSFRLPRVVIVPLSVSSDVSDRCHAVAYKHPGERNARDAVDQKKRGID